MQIIFHIDLNAFYASAEASVDPSLIGKPVVISGMNRRSIVSTASYEARKYGIHSAMPLFQAKQLCKNLIIKPVNFDLYRRLSNDFFTIIRTYSSIIEIASIDECYVDMTDYIRINQCQPYDLALKIQNHVYQSLKLKCSIGIAPNKFLAKMASDMKKPMGITILTKYNLKELMWPLDISDMYGVGKKTVPKLKKVGINTIGDIAQYKNYNKLRTVAGKYALILYRKANGIDNQKVHVNRDDLKSVGHSTTLQYDSNDTDQLYEILNHLAKRVSLRAKKNNLVSNSVSITIKYSRFDAVSRQTILQDYINDYESIISTAKYLFDSNYNGQPVRLLGISLNNTININDQIVQISLFDHQQIKKKENTTRDFIHKLNKEHHLNLKTVADTLKRK